MHQDAIFISKNEATLSALTLFTSFGLQSGNSITSAQQAREAANNLYKRFIKDIIFRDIRDISLYSSMLNEAESLFAKINPLSEKIKFNWKNLTANEFYKNFKHELPTLVVHSMNSNLSAVLSLMASDHLTLGKLPFNVIFVPDLSVNNIQLAAYTNEKYIPFVHYGAFFDCDCNFYAGHLPKPIPLNLLLGACEYGHKSIFDLEDSSVSMLNSATGQQATINKWESYKILKELNMPVPPTTIISRQDLETLDKIESIFKFFTDETGIGINELVLKPNESSQGKGVSFFDTEDGLKPAIFELLKNHNVVILQKRERSLPVVVEGKEPLEFSLRAIVDELGISLIYARVDRSGYPINMTRGASALSIDQLKESMPDNFRQLMPDENGLKSAFTDKFMEIAKTLSCKRISVDFIIKADGNASIFEINGENSGGESTYLGIKSESIDNLAPCKSLIQSLSKALWEERLKHADIAEQESFEKMYRLYHRELETSAGLYMFLFSACNYLTSINPAPEISIDPTDMLKSLVEGTEWKRCIRQIEKIMELTDLELKSWQKKDIYTGIAKVYAARKDPELIDAIEEFPEEIKKHPPIIGEKMHLYMSLNMLDEAKSLWNIIRKSQSPLPEDLCYNLLITCCEKGKSRFGKILAPLISKWHPESVLVNKALEQWEWARDYFITGVATPHPRFCDLKNN